MLVHFFKVLCALAFVQFIIFVTDFSDFIRPIGVENRDQQSAVVPGLAASVFQRRWKSKRTITASSISYWECLAFLSN